MESNIKSSFIPQSPIAPIRSVQHTNRGGFDLILLVGIVVLVASLTLAAGVFLYAQYLSTSATSKLEQLNRAKQAFEASLINDLTRLDTRMRIADTILESHIAPTTLFRLLEQLTLQSVGFSTLDFESSPDGLTMQMRGVAQSMNSIALQADLLSKSGVITNPIFSNINRQANGVNFDFTADLHAAALNYANLIQGGEEAREPDASTQVPTSPFGTPQEGAQQQPQSGQQQPPQQNSGVQTAPQNNAPAGNVPQAPSL